MQKDDVLRCILGNEPVMGGLCYIAATIARAGVISHTGTMQELVFGEYDGTRSPRAEALLKACRLGGIDAELSQDIRKAIWEKFVFLVCLSATTTTVRLPIGRIRGHPRTRQLLLDVMREAVAVGHAQGVALRVDYAEDRLAFCDSLPVEMTSSIRSITCHRSLDQDLEGAGSSAPRCPIKTLFGRKTYAANVVVFVSSTAARDCSPQGPDRSIPAAKDEPGTGVKASSSKSQACFIHHLRLG